MELTLPAEPIPEDGLTPPGIADILDRAAALIEHNGLYDHDWWPDAVNRPWEPGQPCDVTAAIGVAAGYRTGRDIDDVIVGAIYYHPGRLEHVDSPPHPAFGALMRHLHATEPEQVFRWSDDAQAGQVVERLRACAAELRVTEGVPA